MVLILPDFHAQRRKPVFTVPVFNLASWVLFKTVPWYQFYGWLIDKAVL